MALGREKKTLSEPSGWSEETLNLEIENPFYNRFSEKKLQELLESEDSAYFAAGQFCEVELDRFGQPTRWRLKPDLIVESEFENQTTARSWLGNQIETTIRHNRYRLLKKNPKRSKILALGDSWFQYPLLEVDILDQLSRLYAIYSVANPAASLEEAINSGNYLKAEESGGFDFIIVSYGLNDLFGEDFPSFLNGKPNEENSKIDRYLSTEFFKKLSTIEINFKNLFNKLLSKHPNSKIFFHCYDYFIPLKTSAEKINWVGRTMTESGISPQSQRQNLVKYIVDRFADKLSSITQDNQFRNKVTFVDTRNSIPPDQWANELLPSKNGFQAVANAFINQIQKSLADDSLADLDFKERVQQLYSERKMVVRDDLQKFRWGGNAKTDGYSLNAKVDKATSSSVSYKVKITVLSPDKKDDRQVAIFLHDTFSSEIKYLNFKDGAARLEVTAYEAFTIGAYTEGGTMLELDLLEQSDLPEKFYYKHDFDILWLHHDKSFDRLIKTLTKYGTTFYQYESWQEAQEKCLKKEFDFIISSLSAYNSGSDHSNLLNAFDKLNQSTPILLFSDENNYLNTQQLDPLLRKSLPKILLIGNNYTFLNPIINQLPQNTIYRQSSFAKASVFLKDNHCDLIVCSIPGSRHQEEQLKELNEFNKIRKKTPLVFYSGEESLEPSLLQILTNNAVVALNLKTTVLVKLIYKIITSS
ncbi:SGNH/GDSL hydrolase family protein [Dyadobacter sp. CY261]|uniref:SGNH/GDSL hydrolase family protein n=1 Tax=Dyadobacter sp. CY261 TaxID=2907203 RepID=UPI001F29AF26|nr:SGNH/GDSL hydrolase family protein [Dyadobacter sp. CY261]MCF0072923.1 SGNH/GDSL hydrolase family protein [Dyadobacter sp. CY261]